jgi:putative tryptophan/tyrosine transport system substrate-binding protein
MTFLPCSKGPMQRRQFITLLGTIATWPLVASAQQLDRIRIGLLIIANREPFLSQVKKRLEDLGYVERKNVEFELRSAEGEPGRLAELAAELVRLKVDIIIASPTPSVRAAKQATSAIPIVMAPAGDPVGTGLIASLARPGGNITGISSDTAETAGKGVEFVREMLPSARRIAVLANATDPFTKPFLDQIELAAARLGIGLRSTMIGKPDDLDATFSEIAKERLDAVIIQPSLQLKQAVESGLKYHVPTVSPSAGFANAGGLMSYAASTEEIYRQAAVYVDKIVKGAKPADLPVEQPTEFQLSINLKTAKTIGLTVPPALLARADEVVE